MSPPDTPLDPVEPRSLRPVKAPAGQALVFICQRCERRVHKGGDAGRRLARRIRKLSKEALGKGSVRTVFTSCMKLCPRDALAVALVPGRKTGARVPAMFIADADRPKAAARSLLALLQAGGAPSQE